MVLTTACRLAISMSLLQRIGYRCSHWLNNSTCTMASRSSAYFSFIRNTCTFNHCESSTDFPEEYQLRMVKQYVFICSKHEECLYTCLKHVHQVKVISRCKGRPPCTIIQINAKRNKERKHKRKRDGELHAFSIQSSFF